MNFRKFIGGNSRDALRLVRKELGEDAVIISTRQVDGKLEVIAATHEEMQNVTASAPVSPSAAFPAMPAREETGERPFLEFARRREKQHAREDSRKDGAVEAGSLREADAFEARTGLHIAGSEHLMAELKSMRTALESQLAGLVWSESARRSPLRAKFVAQLLAAGFSPGLARAITSRLPDDCAEAQGEKWLASVISANLRKAPADAVIDKGGIYALVGPTGVGKTTTTAKLAARYVMKHGAKNLGLISTDSYRIGAQDQLRIYGRILGIPVHAVQDAEELHATLASMQDKHLVLIDTIGMGQRDPRVGEQAAMLGAPHIRRLLLLNAAAHGETLEDVAKAYGGEGAAAALDGCCLTKLDEAVSAGTVIDAAIRHRLPVHYVSNGQRVPEDLHLPDAQYLIHSALKSGSTGVFRLTEEEAGMILVPELHRTGEQHAGRS